MKVLKFGGTSVGTVESLNNVKKIVETIQGKAVVVVSALGGLTDKLISTARMAADGNPGWKEEFDGIIERHLKIIKSVVPDEKRERVEIKVSDQLERLKKIYEGVFLLRSLPESALDSIVSYGERMSSVIVAAMVKGGKRYFSPDFIKTGKWYGKNIAERKLTEALIKETFASMEEDEKAIVTGFISQDNTTGEITNLGRGGSDYTGALIAAALGAEVLEIWTDVDGFMTSDPRVVKDALIIDHLSFTESMELCTFGAKVIYPPTIHPVFHGNIPIKILNTFNPTAPGTLITEKSVREDFDVKGVSPLKDISLVSISIKNPVEVPDILRRTMNILSENVARLIPVSNHESESEIKVAISSVDGNVSIEQLKKEFAPEIVSAKICEPVLKDKKTAIAVVGKNMRSRERLAARISHTLQRNGIEVEAYSAESNTTLIYIVDEDKGMDSLRIIHSLIFT